LIYDELVLSGKDFRHSQEMGLKIYHNMLKSEGVIRTERHVFDKMIEYKRFLNRRELIHAEDYMNWNYFGITDNIGNPIKVKLPFEVSQIVKKRQRININKILELK